MAQWYSPLTWQPEQSGGQGFIPGRAPSHECHDKGSWNLLGLLYLWRPSADTRATTAPPPSPYFIRFQTKVTEIRMFPCLITFYNLFAHLLLLLFSHRKGERQTENEPTKRSEC